MFHKDLVHPDSPDVLPLAHGAVNILLNILPTGRLVCQEIPSPSQWHHQNHYHHYLTEQHIFPLSSRQVHVCCCSPSASRLDEWCDDETADCMVPNRGVAASRRQTRAEGALDGGHSRVLMAGAQNAESSNHVL
ncbi:unnamed protein product [Pleuronectes platessa]|uniref:Uncharacterized protein n=1 Tax=Pleuronectes platessa TaxID=8262 RepID=A0A9N7VJF7_PLEPL|nr:unnamed protein product [Pleuronectes platessa]